MHINRAYLCLVDQRQPVQLMNSHWKSQLDVWKFAHTVLACSEKDHWKIVKNLSCFSQWILPLMCCSDQEEVAGQVAENCCWLIQAVALQLSCRVNSPSLPSPQPCLW